MLLTKNVHNMLTIFTYHAVISEPLKVFDWCFLDETSFRKHMLFIKKHFEIILLSQAVERLHDGKTYQPMAAITFDDGFQNMYDVAYPILYENRIPATVFPVTGLINTDGTLWNCRLNQAFTLTKNTLLNWHGESYDISHDALKAKVSAKVQRELKKYKHPQLLEELENIILELGDEPDSLVEMNSPYRMLSNNAITEMTASGLIEFGAHTHTHPILSLLTLEEQQDEIRESISIIQDLTGRHCELFAYPNGRRQDYDEETIVILKSFGVRASVTTVNGSNNEETPHMELRRNEYSGKRGAVLLPFKESLSILVYKLKQMLYANLAKV